MIEMIVYEAHGRRGIESRQGRHKTAMVSG